MIAASGAVGSADLGAEAEDDERGPIRRCVATGERLPRERMIRCVVNPEGALVTDLGAILPGRGLWIAANRAAVATALKKRAFDRAARRGVAAPPDLADQIEAALVRRVIDAIGLARRGGRAFAGFEKVASALRAGQVGLLLEAIDGAENGRRKLGGLGAEVPMSTVLTAAELGTAFGRDHVVHVAILAGSLAARLRLDGDRLSGFRDAPASTPAGVESAASGAGVAAAPGTRRIAPDRARRT